MAEETENEQIVIEAGNPNHPHDKRVVGVQHGAETVTIPPTFMHNASSTFKRTQDKTPDGLAIFRPEPA